MPPTRRSLRALGSLQLVGYANNPTRVITELAFIADAQVNVEGGQGDVSTPLEVQFEEFMDGVNSRGKGTKARQKKMTIEQAAAVLLVTVQKGHVELIVKKNDPHTIDVIRVLPEAKKMLAAFLPKLRGYGDIPYDQQYRGAIALAKRHFFPKGKAPTKKELMALLLQSYQEKRELTLGYETRPRSTKAVGIQMDLEVSNGSSHTSNPCARPVTCTNAVEILPTRSNSWNRVELPSDGTVAGAETSLEPSEADLKSHDLTLESETGPVQLAACTPTAPRCFNPYMTPVSNPRHADHVAVMTSSLNASPTPATGSPTEIALDEDSLTDKDMGELLQATATSQGRLSYYYNKFVIACQKITFLEGQKEDIQREFDFTKKKLDEAEQHLREANADKWKLRKWVDALLHRVDSIHRQLGLLHGMTDPETLENEWTVCNPES